jgi:threonine dehydrogenase-like Zn-dependent dehydrogenase
VRAVVLDSDGLPELTEVPEPTGPGLRVRVAACGLCGSDVEKLGRAAPGTVLGHEVSGVLDNGTRVTVMHRVPCGVCDRCLAGHQSTCGEFRALRIDPGGFAQTLRASHCVPLPDSFGEHDGVWVEPLACILRAADLVPRGRVLVVGCGAVGRLWIQVLVLRGHDVVAVDPRDDRLAGARGLGAEVDADPVGAAVLTAPAGMGAALARLEPGGTLVVFAADEEDARVSVDAIYRKELHVVGSRSASPAYFRDAVELLPEIVLPPVTTLPLERFLEGVELYRRGDALKVVFTP